MSVFSRIYHRGLDGGRSLLEVIFYCFDLGFGIDEVGVWLTLYQRLSAVSADLPALSVRSCKGSVVRVAIMRLENVGNTPSGLV